MPLHMKCSVACFRYNFGKVSCLKTYKVYPNKIKNKSFLYTLQRGSFHFILDLPHPWRPEFHRERVNRWYGGLNGVAASRVEYASHVYVARRCAQTQVAGTASQVPSGECF